MASPWPTSQANTTAPSGGHPEATHRSGTAPTAVASASTTMRRRRFGRRAATNSPTVVAASRIPPTTPDGHGTASTGTPAPALANATSHRAGHDASQAKSSAPPGHSGESTADPTPSSVAGATAGAASRFAGTATRLTSPDNATMIGPQATCAAAGTASASASPPGTPRARRASRHRGASSTNAPVATTDKANPASTASAGSTSRPTTTAAANAGVAELVRPEARASRPTAPMAAARTTLGDGRARMTKPTRAIAQMAADSHGAARHQRATKRTTPRTIATLAPLTATKWVRPVVRNSSASAGSNRLVSPMTRPGSRPPGSAGNGTHAVCRPARSRPAAS
jgi:hypothetical protein